MEVVRKHERGRIYFADGQSQLFFSERQEKSPQCESFHVSMGTSFLLLRLLGLHFLDEFFTSTHETGTNEKVHPASFAAAGEVAGHHRRRGTNSISHSNPTTSTKLTLPLASMCVARLQAGQGKMALSMRIYQLHALLTHSVRHM